MCLVSGPGVELRLLLYFFLVRVIANSFGPYASRLEHETPHLLRCVEAGLTFPDRSYYS